MSSMAARQWNSVRNSQAWKGTAAFLHWWRSELVAGMPDSWRALLDHRPERLMVARQEEDIVLWRDDNGHDELGRFRIGDEPETARQVVLAALGQIEEEQPQTIFLIEGQRVLSKQVTMPAAAEENLRQVLSFEMDRHTPFKADQVYFDCRVIARNAAQRTVRVELVVVPRSVIDEMIELAGERGLSLDAIDVQDAPAEGEARLREVNLLPASHRARRHHRQFRLNLILAGVFLLLLYAVMWQSLVAREQSIEALQNRVDESRAETRVVNALRDDLIEAREAARFLTEKKSSQPVLVDLVDDLTRILPDETWLQRLQVNSAAVILTGQAPEAASLIGLLEGASCLTAPAFKGAVTPDPRTGKERFTIEAQLVLGEECRRGPDPA